MRRYEKVKAMFRGGVRGGEGPGAGLGLVPFYSLLHSHDLLTVMNYSVAKVKIKHVLG